MKEKKILQFKFQHLCLGFIKWIKREKQGERVRVYLYIYVLLYVCLCLCEKENFETCVPSCILYAFIALNLFICICIYKVLIYRSTIEIKYNTNDFSVHEAIMYPTSGSLFYYKRVIFLFFFFFSSFIFIYLFCFFVHCLVFLFLLYFFFSSFALFYLRVSGIPARLLSAYPITQVTCPIKGTKQISARSQVTHYTRTLVILMRSFLANSYIYIRPRLIGYYTNIHILTSRTPSTKQTFFAFIHNTIKSTIIIYIYLNL